VKIIVYKCAELWYNIQIIKIRRKLYYE